MSEIQVPVTNGCEECRKLRSELRAANERNADLAGQIKQHAESRVIAPYEEEAIREQGRAFTAMNDQQNEIAKYLREHYAKEIARGEHAGMPLVEVLKRYLSRERQLPRGAVYS
jgi:phage host-nuclease inhibitor protein Gam